MLHRRLQGIASGRRVFLSFAVLSLLQACGDTEEEAASTGATPDDETEYSVALSGSVGDGPIVSANLNIYSGSGELLTTTLSDQEAEYDVTVRTKGKHYPLTIEAVGGIDLATSAAPGFRMRSIARSPRNNLVANINPFTTLIVSSASQMPSGLTQSNVDAATTSVMAEFNSGMTSELSLDPVETPIDDSNLAEIVMASEALAEVFRRTRRGLGQSAGSEDEVIESIAADMADGALDGRGGTRVNRRVSAAAVIASAQVMLETMPNRLRVGGQDVTPVLDNIIRDFSSSANPALTSSRPITRQMIVQARRGIDAAIARNDSGLLRSIRNSLDGLRPGMSSEDVADNLAPDASISLDPTLDAIGSASDEELDEILGDEPQTPANTPPVISGTPPAAVMGELRCGHR